MKNSTDKIKAILKTFGGEKYLAITKDKELLKKLKAAGISGYHRNQTPQEHDRDLIGFDAHLIVK